MRQILFIFAITLLINGGYGMPTENSRYCKACTNLVNFVKNLTENYDDNDKPLFSSLINWCADSDIGDKKTCFYLLKSLEPAKERILSNDFCRKIEACKDVNSDSENKNSDDNSNQGNVNERFSNSSDVTCDFCINTFTHLKEILASQQTENEIKLVLSKSCDYLGNFKNECLKMWDQNLDDIFDFLRNAIDPKKICDETGFCDGNKLSTEANEKRKIPVVAEVINIGPIFKPVQNFNPECIICEKLLTYVHNYIGQNRTEEAIKSALDEVCGALFSGARKDKCDEIVDRYYPSLIRIIELGTLPEIACSMLGLCVDISIKPNCILCKNVIKYIYSRLQDNKTEEKIREELDKVCDRFLPLSQREECEKMVKNYTETIVSLILQEFTPEKACQYLDLCDAKKTIPLTRVHLAAGRVANFPLMKLVPAERTFGATFIVNPELCDVCRHIFGMIYTQVKNKKNRDEVVAALEFACKICPTPDKCSNFVARNVDRIIELVAKEISPDNACSLLHVCTYPKESHEIKWTEIERNEAEVNDLSKIKVNKVDGEQDDNREPYNPIFLSPVSKEETICFTCQVVAHFIQEQLYNNDTESEINTFIEKHLCSLINTYGISIADDKCVEFINTYGPMIENIIAQKYFDPSTLCFKELKLCPKMKTEDDRHLTKIQFELIKPNKQMACDICVKAVNGLDEILAKIPIEKNITVIAENICKSLPDNEINECKQIIQTYASYFVQLIGRLGDAKKVCHAVDLCMIPGQVHLLGAHKCTYGPTYWCHTAAHAEACKATDYCKANIWQPIVN